jgi:hypothetical protein
MFESSYPGSQSKRRGGTRLEPLDLVQLAIRLKAPEQVANGLDAAR